MNIENLTIDELRVLVSEQDKKIVSITAEKDKEIVELKDKLSKAEETISQADEKIGKLNDIIGSAKNATIIETAPEKKKVPTIPTETVEFAGKEYKWNRAQFRLPGNISKTTAEEASTDDEILKRILDIPGQEILTEVV